jgi:hypothetical protein
MTDEPAQAEPEWMRAALTRRIERWARNNPNEYLTVEDAAVKFGCTVAQFRVAVANLRADGRKCVETVVVWRAREAI